MRKDIEDYDEEHKRFFIEHKLSSLHTAGNVCMTWWVSSVVFAGTILAAVWLQRIELRNSPFMMWVLGPVLTGFFFGVTYFGYMVIRYLEKFKNDVNLFPKRGVCLTSHQSKIKELFRIDKRSPKKAKEKSKTCTEGDVLICQLFHTEVDFFIRGMWAGTICFVLVMVVWILFWASLFLRNCCNPPIIHKAQAIIRYHPSRLSSSAR